MKKIFLLILMPIAIYSADLKQELFECCEEGRFNDIKKLEDKIPKYLPIKDKSGFSLITLAVFYGHIDIAELLLSKGADIESKINCGARPLHIACYLGRSKMVKFLVSKGADINSIYGKSYTPILVAIVKGYEDIVKFLLSKNVNIRLRGNNGLTPINIVFNKINLPIVALFLEKLNVAEKAKYINWSFIVAATKGNLDALEYFLSNGAEIEHQDIKTRKTALVIAVEYGDMKMVEFLLSKNVQINPSNYMISPLRAFCEIYCDLLMECKNYKGVEFMDFMSNFKHLINIAKLLISHGANINARVEFSRTILHTACMKGNSMLVEFLLENGAKLDISDCNGYTPNLLSKAFKNKHVISYLESLKNKK